MPVVNWPPTLIDRIASGQWVLFIGSGVSASCKNENDERPPSWSELLTTLVGLIADEGHRRVGQELISKSELLAAADHIRFVLAQESNVATYHQTIRTAVDGPQGDKFEPSPMFDALLNLNPKVVFTTNYDKLFEIASKNGFAVHSFTSDSVSHDLRVGEPVLVKLHGSTDAINEIVLTRTDYARVMREGRDVLDVLSSLSRTSTILFVGYSLDDPDIQLVLQAVGRPAMSPEAHFMLAPEPASPARVPVFKESFGVSVLAYPTGDHGKAENAIVELGDLVSLERRRRSTPL